MIRALALAFLLAAGPAAAQDDTAVWMLITEGPGAYLAYGVPDSDDGRIALHCGDGAGKVTVLAPVSHRVDSRLDESQVWRDMRGRPEPWPVTVTLASGKTKAQVEGAAHPDEMNGGSTIEADLDVASPVMKAFAASGRLSVSAYDETVEEPPAPRRDVEILLRTCR